MLVFFGTSAYSAQFLTLVQKKGLKIDLVVSAPPQPVGRQQVLTENPTITLARHLKIPFLTSLTQLSQNQLGQEALGLMLDFNRLIPQKTIKMFKKGIINIHFSRLPQYRGPAPVQATILNGDKKAWISDYLLDEKLDEGPVLKQKALPLDFSETTASLYQKLIQKAAEQIPSLIADYLQGKIQPQPQKGQPSYTTKLTTAKAKIDWEKSAQETERLIRAAYPEPGAWTEIRLETKNHKPKIKRLKVLKAHLKNNDLILDQVQLEGKNPVAYKQFKEGYPEAKIVT